MSAVKERWWVRGEVVVNAVPSERFTAAIAAPLDVFFFLNNGSFILQSVHYFVTLTLTLTLWWARSAKIITYPPLVILRWFFSLFFLLMGKACQTTGEKLRSLTEMCLHIYVLFRPHAGRYLVWSTVGRSFHKEFKEYQGKGKSCFDTFSVAAVELSSEGAWRRIEEALNQSGALAMFTGGFCFRRIGS